MSCRVNLDIHVISDKIQAVFDAAEENSHFQIESIDEKMSVKTESVCESVTLVVEDSPCAGSGGAVVSPDAGNQLKEQPNGLMVHAGMRVTRKAGSTISALVGVCELPDGTVQPLDYRDAAHIDQLVGVTLTSASAGAEVTIQRSGQIDAAGLSLTAGRVWLGQSGQLTQTPPETGFDILLGYATAEQRIYLDPQPAITLEE